MMFSARVLATGLRSVGAVGGAYLAMMAVSTMKFAVITRWFPGALPEPGSDEFPSALTLALVLAIDLGTMILAGYLAAALAARAKLGHAIALGGLMIVMGLVVMMLNWGHAPLWYQVTLVSVALPAAATGGYLRAESENAGSV